MSGGEGATGSAPLVLTLGLDERSTAYFDGLRTAHFPRERLLVGAHLTFFHALPAAHEAEVAAEVRATAAISPPLDLRASRLLLLGRGVAFAVEGPGIAELRASLVTTFAPLGLSAQDLHRHRPHVTIQNKVDPAVARALHDELAASFAPFAVRGEALRLWRYVGGPWEHVLDARLTG